MWLAKKQAIEAAFTEWVNRDENRKALYGNALKDIQTAVEGRKELQNAAQYLMEAIFFGMESVMFGRNLTELERMLADPETEQEEIDNLTESLKEFSAVFYKDYNPPTDKKVMTAMVRLLIEKLDEAYLPSNILEVKTKYNGDADKYVDKYFKKSFVTDQARFLAFLDEPSLKVLRKDPAYRAVVASQNYFEIRGRLAEFDEAYSKGQPSFPERAY